MNVGDDKVGVVDEQVDWRGGREDSAQPPMTNIETQSQGEAHRRGKPDGTAPIVPAN